MLIPSILEFYQRVRSIQLTLKAEGRAIHSVSTEHYPSQEIIRFSVLNSLAFPVSAIAKLTHPTPEKPRYEMQIAFMGMTGAMGVLPNHDTALVIDLLHKKQTAWPDYLGLFDHTAIQFVYLRWEKQCLYIGAERGDTILDNQCDNLRGIGEGSQNRSRISDAELRSFTSFFLQEQNINNLIVMLNDYLQVPVSVMQHQERWLYLSPERRTKLDADSNGQNSQARLDVNILLDDCFLAPQGKIRLCLGPLTWAEYERLMPNGDLAILAVELATLFMGPLVDFDLMLTVLADQIPRGALGAYDLVLMSLATEDEINLANLLTLSAKNGKQAVVIKQGENISLYGAHLDIGEGQQPYRWKITPLNASLFDSVSFPAPDADATRLNYKDIPTEIRAEIKSKKAHLGGRYLGFNTILGGKVAKDLNVIFTVKQIRTHAPEDTRETVALLKTKFETPSLYGYFLQSLEYRQQQLFAFSKKHPYHARSLGILEHSISDYHVRALEHQIAISNARVLARLKDDYPEVGQTLLAKVEPQFVDPIPSMALVQFQPNPALLSRHDIPQGRVIATDAAQGPVCEFRTCSAVTLWPITVAHAAMQSGVLGGIKLPAALRPKACLHLTLRCPAETTFAQLQPDSLRFFINAPRDQAFMLYEWLMRHHTHLALANAFDDPNPVFLDPSDYFVPVGFCTEDPLLPSPHRHLPHRLMQEFFHLPEKFLFFDLQKLAPLCEQHPLQNELHLFFYFDTPQPLLEQNISSSWFALGCTPIVNVFEAALPPLEYTPGEEEEYLLSLDTTSGQGTREYYAVQSVTTTSVQSHIETRYVRQGTERLNIPTRRTGAWDVRRQAAWRGPQFRPEGYDLFLTLIEPKDRYSNDTTLLQVIALCTNGNLPSQLFSEERPPRFSLKTPSESVTGIRSLVLPTQCHWPSAAKNATWRWLSHLKPNIYALSGGEIGAHALAEMFKNYDFNCHSGHIDSCLEGLIHVKSEVVTDFTPAAPGEPPPDKILTRGLEVTLTVDEEHFFEDGHLYLFGMVFSFFLTFYSTSMNFTQLIIETKSGKRYVYPARLGIRPML